MTRTRHRLRCTVAAAAALAAGLGGMAATATTARAAEAGTSRTAAALPLPPELESIRATEAVKLYGSPAERPLADRKTGLISLGDSEISGEGVGT